MNKFLLFVICFSLSLNALCKCDSLNDDCVIGQKVILDKALNKSINGCHADDKSNITIQNNLPKSSNNLFITLLPLITLVLGFLLNKLYDYFVAKKKIKRTGKNIVHELILLEQPLKNQIAELKRFLEENPITRFVGTDLVVNLELECDSFKSINRDDLVEFIRLKNKEISNRDALLLANDVVKIGKVISMSFDTLKIRYENEYRTDFGKAAEKYNSEYQLFHHAFRNYCDEIEKRSGNPATLHPICGAVINLISQHITPHSNSGEIDLFDLEDKFFLPVFQNLYLDRANLVEAVTHLSNCAQQIKAMRMAKRYVFENCEKIKDSFEKADKKLQILIEKTEPLIN